MANLNVRVDENLKADAQALYKAMGLDLSTAINMFLRQSLVEHGLPFRPSTLQTNQSRLLQSIQQIEEGKVITKTIEELEDMENE